MKVAIIADTHWGYRSDGQAHLDYFTRFYREVFFPVIDEYQIEAIIHLGDLVDRRKYVNFRTAETMRVEFIDQVIKRGIEMELVVGNHDVTFKNTNETNALKELGINRFSGVRMVSDRIREVRYGDQLVALVPWICDENRSRILEQLEKTQATIAMGHLELNGFKMYKNTPEMTHGMDPAPFRKFDVVLSGHFHHRSVKGNMIYVGAPYEMNWSDAGDDRGFHVWDTETGEMEYIRNHIVMHRKLHYDEGEVFSTGGPVTGQIVKVIVRNREDGLAFDAFIKSLEMDAPADIQVVEDHLHMDAAVMTDDDVEVEVEDTPVILRRSVADLPDLEEGCRSDLTRLLLEVHAEAAHRR